MIKVRKLKSGSWNAQVYSHKEDGKNIYKSITAPTKAECEYLCAQFKKEKKIQKKQRKDLTLRMAIEEYIAEGAGDLSPTTLSAYKKILKYAFVSLMDVKLKEINDEIVADAVDQEKRRKCQRKDTTISAKTIRNEWMLIASVLKKHNLHFDVKLPKVSRKNEDLPDPAIVLNAIKGTDIELPCLLAMWMSLRLSEVRGLTCKSVKGNALHIDQVKVLVDGREEIKKPKTDASIRKIEIPPYILQMINNTPAMKKYAETKKNGFLIDIPADTLRHKFYRLMEKVDLDLSFHDLRHYYATISLTVLSINPKLVQVSGGWHSFETMQNVYNSSINKEQEQASAVRNNYFESILK